MASPEILYRGGEVDSLNVVSGTLIGTTSYIDTAFSAAGINLSSTVLTEIFRDSAALQTDVTGGDSLWGMCYIGGSGTAGNGTHLTVYDNSGRPAFRLDVTTGFTCRLHHNTSSNSSPTWTLLGQFANDSFGFYAVFKVVTGASKTFALYINGELKAEGSFSNAAMAALTYFTAGPGGASITISQILFSRNIPLVHARVMSRKANAAGTYAEMTGSYSDIVKTTLNDATGIVSGSVGQITTNNYQDITVPSGMKMHPDVGIWNRVRNSGDEPSSMKQACIVEGTLQKSGHLPVALGLTNIPTILTEMTPAKFNACEIGQESTTP